MATPALIPAPDQLLVVVDGSVDVTGVARDVLSDAVSSFGSEVVDEASKYEAARNRPFTAVIHYSPSDIGQAESVVRNRGFSPSPRRPGYYGLRVAQWVLTGAAGVMGGLIPSWPPAGYFLTGLAMAALALTIYLEYTDYQERNNGKRKSRR